MWNTEPKNDGVDYVWNTPETGIASSPLEGNANLQNVNISTQKGEALVSYGRISQQQETISSETLTAVSSTLFTAPSSLQAGQWINVLSTTVGSATALCNYLVVG